MDPRAGKRKETKGRNKSLVFRMKKATSGPSGIHTGTWTVWYKDKRTGEKGSNN